MNGRIQWLISYAHVFGPMEKSVPASRQVRTPTLLLYRQMAYESDVTAALFLRRNCPFRASLHLQMVQANSYQHHTKDLSALYDILSLTNSTLKNKNQLDVIYYFIVLLIGSKCFGHYYAHHQELETIMLITTLVVSFLVCCRLEVRCG